MVRELWLDTDPRTFLTFMPLEEFRLYQAGTATGKPKRYTLKGTTALNEAFIFAPIPDDSYTGKLTYWRTDEFSDDTNNTNSFGRWPDIWLYGCLHHAWLFLQNEQKAVYWLGLYNKAIADQKTGEVRDKYAGSALRPRAMYQETPYR